MNHWKKIVVTLAAGVTAFLVLSASSCDSPGQNKAEQQREDKSAAVILCGAKGQSQECLNLQKKFQRDNDPNRVTYVYLLSWTGEFIGYYVAKGKVSSNQSQMGPMDTTIDVDDCSGCGSLVVEAPGDDGSYGPNEDGIFFFTADDTKITWNGMYQQSDKPLNIKVPLLYGS